MSSSYREFDDFAHSVPSRPANPHVTKLLQEIEENIRHFEKNVNKIEEKTDLLHTRQDTPALREDIIHLVSDTAQLAKITNTPIQKLRLQSTSLSYTERNQFERLMTTFSSAGIKYKNLQRLTRNLEKELLNQVRQRTHSSYSDDPVTNPFGADNDNDTQQMIPKGNRNEYNMQHNVQMQLEDDEVLLVEREQQMRQLENDILDINDIFRDLGTMVHDQGEMIDNIEANVENAAVRVEGANQQLGRAVSHKRCSRKLTLIIVCIVVTIVAAIVIGVVILAVVLKGYLNN